MSLNHSGSSAFPCPDGPRSRSSLNSFSSIISSLPSNRDTCEKLAACRAAPADLYSERICRRIHASARQSHSGAKASAGKRRGNRHASLPVRGLPAESGLQPNSLKSGAKAILTECPQSPAVQEPVPIPARCLSFASDGSAGSPASAASMDITRSGATFHARSLGASSSDMRPST